jgi:hypothetical protein
MTFIVHDFTRAVPSSENRMGRGNYRPRTTHRELN